MILFMTDSGSGSSDIAEKEKAILDKIKRLDTDIFISGNPSSKSDIITKSLINKAKSSCNIFITHKAALSLTLSEKELGKAGITCVEEVINPNVVFS